MKKIFAIIGILILIPLFSYSARTDTLWQERLGSYLETSWPEGRNILINGTNKYLNFGSVSGTTGYGFRDNSGTMEFKDSGGSWAAFGTGGGGGGSSVGWAASSGTTTLYSNLNIPTIISLTDQQATSTDAVLEVWGEVNADYFTASSSNSASTFPLASTTALTATRAYLTQIANLTTNGFIKTGSGNGTLTVDTNTYLQNIVEDTTPQLGGTLDAQSNDISNVATIGVTEIDIGSFLLKNETIGGVNRLLMTGTGGNDPSELFLQARGASSDARILLSGDENTNNYEFFEISSNGTAHHINSSSTGSGTTLPMDIRINDDDVMIFNVDKTVQLAQLTSNGFVKTTDNDGTLTVDTTSYTPQTRTLTVAGTSLDITSSAGAQDLSANRTWTLSFPRSATLAGNPAFSANHAGFGSNGILFEGSSADTIEGLLQWNPSSSDKTLTLPNATDQLVGRATTDTLTNKTINGSNNTITNVSLASGVTGTLPVANGGTGNSSLTAYAVLAGGTTGTGALQQVSGLGTSGQVLTSNGAAALPTWQDATGGGGGGGSLSTTTEKILAGAAATVSYVTDEFMLGGSASTSAEFLFDYASSTLQIRSADSVATTTWLSTDTSSSTRIGAGAQNSDDGWFLMRGIEWDFSDATAVLRSAGTLGITAISTALNWTYTGIVDLTGATVNLGAGAIDAITEIASGLKTGADTTLVTGTAGTNGNLGQWNSDGDLVGSGLATADVVTGASTDTFTNKTFDANGTGNSISNIDLTADVINTLPVANGGTGITSLGTGVATWWGTPSSANFLSALTDPLNLGDEASFEIPNAAAPTTDATGEIALDTTDNQLQMFDGTATRVYAREHHKIFSVTIASTSEEFVSGGILPIPPERDGYELTEFHCYVSGGTSVVANVSDGTNDTETISCGTTLTTDLDVATNDTATAGELMELQIGTITGTPDYLTFTAYGHITVE